MMISISYIWVSISQHLFYIYVVSRLVAWCSQNFIAWACLDIGCNILAICQLWSMYRKEVFELEAIKNENNRR